MKTTPKASVAVLALALLPLAVGVVAPGSQTTPSAAAATKQSGRTLLMPQIVHRGPKVAPSRMARLTGRVRFRPARPGRPVVIQRKVGNNPWRKVAVKRQNKHGAVAFKGRARTRGGAWIAYRGVAGRWNALGRVPARPQRADVWRTVFREEFRGTGLNLNKWAYRHLGAHKASADRACSASTRRAVRVHNGRVALQVKTDRRRQRRLGDCRGRNSSGELWPRNRHWYQNGHIGTQDRFDFEFGTAAARMKFDRPRGAHGSFWLQSTVPDIAGEGPAADGAEIDVVEYFGKDFLDGDIYSFIHYRDPSGVAHKVPSGSAREVAVKKARKALGRDDDWFKKYHVFSVQWTPRAYTFHVDGIVTRRIRRGVSRVPEYLILSMLSSGWELENMKRRTLPNATHVDWVRVWQK
jgi:beta-glucanase (GH16 family)